MTTKKILHYFFIAFLGVVLVAVFIGLICLTFGFDETIAAGVISFFGALLGGAVTLFGVILTIKSSDKSKLKEELPKKLLNLEKAQRILDITINELYEVDNILDFSTNSFELDLNFTKNYHRYTEEVLDNLREHLIFADSETYKLFLDTAEKINSLEFELTDLQIDVLDFNENYGNPDKVNDQIVNTWTKNKNELTKELEKQNKMLIFKIELIYKDIVCQLHLKHEKLIKELDY